MTTKQTFKGAPHTPISSQQNDHTPNKESVLFVPPKKAKSCQDVKKNIWGSETGTFVIDPSGPVGCGSLQIEFAPHRSPHIGICGVFRPFLSCRQAFGCSCVKTIYVKARMQVFTAGQEHCNKIIRSTHLYPTRGLQLKSIHSGRISTKSPCDCKKILTKSHDRAVFV